MKRASKNLKKRNFFLSYHHSSDYGFLEEFRKKFQSKNFSDYGFGEQDLGESSKVSIAKRIQSRLWSSSVTIILIGEKTGQSSWIDWEIWYSLQDYRDSRVSRRRFKPKGLLALYLPVEKHDVPQRLRENIDSGYAMELKWEELDSLFDKVVVQAYNNRAKIHLIRNSQPLMDNPSNIFRNYIRI